jgi:SHS2 domain-containing protein
MIPRNIMEHNTLHSGWEVLDHTADIGFRAWAPSLDGLFEKAAEAVFSLAVHLDRVESRQERLISVEGMDREELLVAWLQELLYLWTADDFVACGFRVQIGLRSEQEPEEPWRLMGLVDGEPWDSERHEAYTDVKAVTYHNLRIQEDRDEAGTAIFRVEIILDI